MIEAECLRLFRDLHSQDPLFRRLDRQAGSKLTIRRMFGGASSSSSAAFFFDGLGLGALETILFCFYGGLGGWIWWCAAAFCETGQCDRAAGARSPRTLGPRRGETNEIDDSEAEQVTLEEVLQTEVQNLAEEIAQAGRRGRGSGILRSPRNRD